MKKVLIGMILVFLANSLAYSQEVVYIKKQKFEGYIYPKDFPIWGFPPENNRYTPQKQDIEQAENIIQDNIRFICTELMHKRYGYCRTKKLRKYIRQYVGYVTEDKQIIIKIFFSKKGTFNNHTFKDDIILVQDGGSDYWQISVNLTIRTLFDLFVNGEG